MFFQKGSKMLAYVKKNVFIKLFLKNIYFGLKGLKSIPRLFLIWLRIRVKNSIIVIGDSHTLFFTGLSDFEAARSHASYTLHGINIPRSYPWGNDYVIFHLGGVLAYNALKEKSTVNTFKKTKYVMKYFLKKGGKIICSMGEIDIGYHVITQMKKKNQSTYTQIVDEILDRYIDYLQYIKNRKEGVEVYVWAPIASVSDDNNQIGAVGGEVERNLITKYFVSEIKRRCEPLERIFVLSIFDRLVDENGSTIEKYYSPDGEHLCQMAFKIVEEELSKHDLWTENG